MANVRDISVPADTDKSSLCDETLVCVSVLYTDMTVRCRTCLFFFLSLVIPADHPWCSKQLLSMI